MSGSRQNIVLITIDALSWSVFENLNGLFLKHIADDGILFTKAEAPATATGLSMPAIMTGIPPAERDAKPGITNHHHSTLAELLRSAGYYTIGLSARNPYCSRWANFHRGFDYFSDFFPGTKSSPDLLEIITTGGKQSLPGRVVRWLSNRSATFLTFMLWLRSRKHAESASAIKELPGRELTDAALEILDSTESDKPVFLWLHYMDTHTPYCPDGEWDGATGKPGFKLMDAVYTKTHHRALWKKISDKERIRLTEGYVHAVEYVDTEIKRLLKHDSLLGAYTIITSDHGEMLGEEGIYGHPEELLHPSQLRVPLILNGPGWERQVVNERVSLLRIKQMLLELAKGETDIFPPDTLLT